MSAHPRLHARFRLILRLATAALLLTVIAAGAAWKLSFMSPTWYQPPPDVPATRDLASTVENRLVEEVHLLRPPNSTWTVRLRQEQINAWLATRLRQWVEHQQDLDWPEALGIPQVRLTADGIDLAADFAVDPHSRDRFVVARLLPVVSDDGISFQLQRIGAGRLLLPGDPIVLINEQLLELEADDVIDDGVAHFIRDLAASEQLIARDIELADDRVLRIIDVRLRDSSIDIEFLTLQPDGAPTVTRSPAARISNVEP